MHHVLESSVGTGLVFILVSLSLRSAKYKWLAPTGPQCGIRSVSDLSNFIFIETHFLIQGNFNPV